MPPNMLLKLAKAAVEWKIVAKNLSKKSRLVGPAYVRFCNKLLTVHKGNEYIGIHF
jgi:hypothetical protein